jgi:hypothetical protein
MFGERPAIPTARVHRCADGVRPEVERAARAMRRRLYPLTFALLGLVGTIALVCAIVWLMSSASGGGVLPIR